ncbi:virus viroplasmin [Paenibacillus algorifonticola]|uniref:Ribonuclease H n=1 Tax=Paenibacillus algorifonticola TaxID=684063 RepID=A0A1I2CJ07_9BACL|nr:RNase H1/viroplasmin domain-containing protein [Paenibacillus algorifonticola]SFE68105.1 virus viroplasmin [Paenibacillus algorifonticola]
MADKYYVVWIGRKSGIYSSWQECQRQTSGFPNAKFKSYTNKQDAEKAYNDDTKQKANKTAKGANKRNKTQLKQEESKKKFEFEYAEERVGQKWPVICSTGETAHNYNAYLKTEHWEKIKTFYFVFNSKSCRLCRSKRILNLHHKTYERIGNEKIRDLVCLCQQCHHKLHEINDLRVNDFIGRQISGGPKEFDKNITSVIPDRSLEFYMQKDHAKRKTLDKKSDWIATRDGIVIPNQNEHE